MFCSLNCCKRRQERVQVRLSLVNEVPLVARNCKFQRDRSRQRQIKLARAYLKSVRPCKDKRERTLQGGQGERAGGRKITYSRAQTCYSADPRKWEGDRERCGELWSEFWRVSQLMSQERWEDDDDDDDKMMVMRARTHRHTAIKKLATFFFQDFLSTPMF